MSTSSISSTLSDYSSLVLQLTQTNSSSSTATLLSSLDSSSSAASLIETVCSGASDLTSISAISTSLNSIAKAAEKSGVSEVMDNVRLFAIAMQSDGVDTVSILQYLGSARELAESDPESFLEIFSTDGASSTDDTIDALTDDSTEETTTEETES